MGWLCCPDCHQPLSERSAQVCCSDCGQSWRVRHGIADFTDSARRAEDEEFGTYARALPELVRIARHDGWLEALEKVICPLPEVGPGMFSYVTDESKGDLIHVTNIGRGHKVLDLGCGLGAVSVAIAQRGADCHVVDVSHEQTIFTAIRCRQLGCAGVKAACAGDDMKLPLADGYLDAIVMNGVLEWLGCAERYRGSPEDSQLAMLREAHRVLRPGGELYVASKNLYSLLHFLGTAPDHGTRLPWIGILPPQLQRLLTVGRVPDSGARIYGLRAYRRLFRTAGFVEIAAYALMPEFRHPKRFIPLSAPAPVAFRGPDSSDIYNRRLERLLARLLPCEVLRRLVYCYGFLLEKK